MNKIKIFFTIKGGVGKTTGVTNLALGLKNKGYSVLLIDLNAQGNATDKFLGNIEIKETITNYFLNDIKELSIYTTNKGVDVVPSDLELSLIGAKTSLMHTKLKAGINKIIDKYDYILIDCNTCVTDLTYNALVACDEVVIPVILEEQAEKAIKLTISEIEEVNEAYEKNIQYKLLFNMFSRTKIERQRIEKLKNEHECYEQIIRTQNKYIKETSYNDELVIETKSGVSEDYNNFVNEVEAL